MESKKYNSLIGGDTIFTPRSAPSDTIFTPSNRFVSDTIFTPSVSSLVYSDPYLSSDIVISDSFGNVGLVSSPYSPLAPLSPFAPLTLSFDYSRPLLGVYDTIDTDPHVRRKMLDYYYDVVRDKWLLDELNDILNYFKFSDGKVKMISSMSDYSPKNISGDSDKVAQKKVEYIEEFLLTKYDMDDVLSRFTKETNTKWVNLPKNEFFLRQAIKEYLMKQITKKLKKAQSGGQSDLFF